MQIGFSCELPEVLLNVNSLLCSKVVQPWPVHLPLYIKVLLFSNMDQEIISLLCL